jgi:hypothetical protein
MVDQQVIDSLNDLASAISRLAQSLSVVDVSGIAQGAVGDNTLSSGQDFSSMSSLPDDAAGQPEPETPAQETVTEDMPICGVVKGGYEPVTPAQETVTRAELIEFLSSLKSDPEKKKGLVAIFKTFGTSKLPEIAEEHYPAIMAQARSL